VFSASKHAALRTNRREKNSLADGVFYVGAYVHSRSIPQEDGAAAVVENRPRESFLSNDFASVGCFYSPFALLEV
jgi:hypothetical protein